MSSDNSQPEDRPQVDAPEEARRDFAAEETESITGVPIQHVELTEDGPFSNLNITVSKDNRRAMAGPATDQPGRYILIYQPESEAIPERSAFAGRGWGGQGEGQGQDGASQTQSSSDGSE